jgi:hypothetical protein
MSYVIHPTLKWKSLKSNSKSINNELIPIKPEHPFMFHMESLCTSGLLCKVKEVHKSIAKSLFTISGIKSKKEDTKGFLLSIVPLFITARNLMYLEYTLSGNDNRIHGIQMDYQYHPETCKKHQGQHIFLWTF